MKKLIIIGIDSLDPYTIIRYRDHLKNFSKLISNSPTFISKSIFPPDTIPAWGSIYTGLHPGNHGLFYVYDIFDPNLSDLKKLNIDNVKGKTFWDYAGMEGYKTIINFPMLMFPSWKINGIMISKSYLEKRLSSLEVERDISVYPESVRNKYAIPNVIKDLWGGYPGIKNLMQMSNLGKELIDKDKIVGLELCKNEAWDLFFIYFSHLDIIQHRLWRFFDKTDSTYCENHLSNEILDYYKIFDSLIEEFMLLFPDTGIIIMSDHGHTTRPIKTINLNELLKREGYLIPIKNKVKINIIRKIILELVNKFKIEDLLIKLIIKSSKLTKVSKSIYSSSGIIDKEKSVAFLSNFVGIKSYPHGGIIINKNKISDSEYEKIRNDLIFSLSNINYDGSNLINWIKRPEDLYPGKFTANIFPDLIFELNDNGTGWEIDSELFGISNDHNIASGGHRKDAVFLMHNIEREVLIKDLSIIDIAPTIIDILGIDFKKFYFDGKSILK